jgi:hypothetical protein
VHSEASEQRNDLGSKLDSVGVYVCQHLNLALFRKATEGIRPRSEPDSGNPTVRDRREACGNVGYGGTMNPPHIPKGCVSETLHLMLRAPYFYPDNPVIVALGRTTL